MKAIAKVSSYQTTDGTLHTSQVDAQRHQTKIEIVSLIQSRNPIASASSSPMTPAQVAEFVIGKRADVLALLRDLHDKERRAAKK